MKRLFAFLVIVVLLFPPAAWPHVSPAYASPAHDRAPTAVTGGTALVFNGASSHVDTVKSDEHEQAVSLNSTVQTTSGRDRVNFIMASWLIVFAIILTLLVAAIFFFNRKK